MNLKFFFVVALGIFITPSSFAGIEIFNGIEISEAEFRCLCPHARKMLKAVQNIKSFVNPNEKGWSIHSDPVFRQMSSDIAYFAMLDYPQTVIDLAFYGIQSGHIKKGEDAWAVIFLAIASNKKFKKLEK